MDVDSTDADLTDVGLTDVGLAVVELTVVDSMQDVRTNQWNYCVWVWIVVFDLR